jgi:hypothetical protein
VVQLLDGKRGEPTDFIERTQSNSALFVVARQPSPARRIFLSALLAVSFADCIAAFAAGLCEAAVGAVLCAASPPSRRGSLRSPATFALHRRLRAVRRLHRVSVPFARRPRRAADPFGPARTPYRVAALTAWFGARRIAVAARFLCAASPPSRRGSLRSPSTFALHRAFAPDAVCIAFRFRCGFRRGKLLSRSIAALHAELRSRRVPVAPRLSASPSRS